MFFQKLQNKLLDNAVAMYRINLPGNGAKTELDNK